MLICPFGQRKTTIKELTIMEEVERSTMISFPWFFFQGVKGGGLVLFEFGANRWKSKLCHFSGFPA